MIVCHNGEFKPANSAWSELYGANYDRRTDLSRLGSTKWYVHQATMGRPWGGLRYGRLRNDLGLFGDDGIGERKNFKASCNLSTFEWG